MNEASSPLALLVRQGEAERYTSAGNWLAGRGAPPIRRRELPLDILVFTHR